jgi:hypothetical protein
VGVTHYRPTRESPTVCGTYDPMDDLSTWRRDKVTCPMCLAMEKQATPRQLRDAANRPWER